MEELGDVPLVVDAIILIKLVNALQQIVILVEFLKPFKEEVLANLAFFFSYHLLCLRRHRGHLRLLLIFAALAFASAAIELDLIVVVIIIRIRVKFVPVSLLLHIVRFAVEHLRVRSTFEIHFWNSEKRRLNYKFKLELDGKLFNYGLIEMFVFTH